MFDLKIICSNKKELKFDNNENNNLLEYIEAEIELYKLNTNSLSLTDNIETFRFLPINRTKSLFLINFPEDITLDFFINYIGEEIGKISNIIIITQPNTKFRSLILKFFEQDMADNFYYHYKVKTIKENKSEFLYFVFLRNIIFTTSKEEDESISNKIIK